MPNLWPQQYHNKEQYWLRRLQQRHLPRNDGLCDALILRMITDYNVDSGSAP